MNKKTAGALLFFLIAALLGSYVIPAMKKSYKKQEQSKATRIPQLITAQSDSWNNGDLSGFMSLYWKSDSLPFLTFSGVQYGWQRLYDSYQKGYFESDAKRGQLKFEIEKMIPVESHVYLVPGSWTVSRQDTVLSGKFSLLFKFFENDGWKIIADHTW